MTVILEISEFIGNPVRTGIQRVVRELIAGWPADRPMRVCAYAPELDALYEVPDRAVRLACAGAGAGGIDHAELSLRIAEADAPARRRPLAPDVERILVPEVFYDPARIAFYRRLAACGTAPWAVVHDFAAYFFPDAFKVSATGSNFFLPYLYFVRAARARTFSNAGVARDFRERIARTTEADPRDSIIRLGADGLRVARQKWSPRRRTIVCLGSFDGKKKQEVVFEAYRASSALQEKLDLLFIGRTPEIWQDTGFAALLAGGHPGVGILENASDAAVREALADARATVFIGTSEGFGLPAVESLAAGIPLVAWAGLPALSVLPDEGQVRLKTITPDTVRIALERLIDDAVAEQLWRDAANLRLDTWAGFAAAIAEWMAA